MSSGINTKDKFSTEVSRFEAFWGEFGFDEKDPDLMRILKSNLGGEVASMMENESAFEYLLQWQNFGGAKMSANRKLLEGASKDYVLYNRFGTFDEAFISKFFLINDFIDDLKAFIGGFAGELDISADVMEDVVKEARAQYSGMMPMNFDQQLFGSEMIATTFYNEFPEYRMLMQEKYSLCLDLVNYFYLKLVVRGGLVEQMREEVKWLYRLFLEEK